MDDIDVTSSMGRDLPYVFNVVEAAKMLGFERNFAHTQVPEAAAWAAGAQLRIGWSLRVLRDELLKRFGAGCVARSLLCGRERRHAPRRTGAGVRGGAWRRPGIRRGGQKAVGRAGSVRLGSPASSSRSSRGLTTVFLYVASSARSGFCRQVPVWAIGWRI